MPALKRILETALYVEDLRAACTFYEDVMGLVRITRDERLSSYDVAGHSVLLLFARGGTRNGVKTEGGNDIPPHDASGQQHLAFEVNRTDLKEWERHLATAGVEVLSETGWMGGGQSIYFRDPDGHLLELAGTPGTWPGH